MISMKWSIAEVEKRFYAAADIFRRLPNSDYLGYRSYWPEIIRTPNEIEQADKGRPRIRRPEPWEIDDAMEVLEWVQWLTVEQRKIVWLCCTRLPKREIAKRYDTEPKEIRQIKEAAFALIARRLNAKARRG